MTAFDDGTILEAIAAHYTAATPPAGETLKKAFAYPPDGLNATPAIVLYPGSDSVAYGASNRQVSLSVAATLYLPLVEYARNYARTAKWRAFMRDAMLDAVQLNGTSGVSQASVTGTVVDSSEYGDAPFITITANIQVIGVEVISPSA